MSRRRKGNRRIAPSTVPAEGPEAESEPRTGRAAAVLVHLLMVLGAVGIVGGFFVGGRALSRWLRTSDSFSLQEVNVEGLERLTREEVLRVASIEDGMSIFSLDEQEASMILGQHPWIREAVVKKKMPNAVSVEIVERELVALFWSGSLYRVDADGTIFERHPDGAPVDRVIITGVGRALLSDDKEILKAELRKIIQILREYERMGLGVAAPVRSVHREHGGGIVLYIGDEAREVRLGVGHTRKKLRRLRAVLQELKRDNLAWDYIMVDSRNFPERVVVKLRSS
ncbi:MAG: FtsQ-type POTRA domain-containing protein [Deltaproteobacteria bacterium]|nr:FtsQ-type POTRA domain-containing protein [Deltaproteobacteria bacterium]